MAQKRSRKKGSVEWVTIEMGDGRISSHSVEWVRSYAESEPFSPDFCQKITEFKYECKNQRP